MAKFLYQAILTPDDEGGYSVEFPDLPGCISEGDTYEEAVWMAADAAKTWLASCMAHGGIIPEHTRHEVPQGCEQVVLFLEAEPDYVLVGEVVSAAEAARMLGISAGRVSHMINAGILQGCRKGRHTLVSLASVQARMNSVHGPGRPKAAQA